MTGTDDRQVRSGGPSILVVSAVFGNGTTRDTGRTWRWSNVPIPEAHVAGLLLGVALHVVSPRQAFPRWRGRRILGWLLVGFGVWLVGWAVRTTGDVDVAHPGTLVTTGPYVISRNPMYIGWTVLYAGIVLLANSAWLLLVLPAVVASTHSAVRGEERELAATFGDEYRTYRRSVRRYR